MTDRSVFELIKGVEIFSDLSDQLLHEFARRLKLIPYSSSETIIQKGDHGDSMYIIADGSVKIHDGDHIVAVTEAGNFFGEFSLLDAGPRSMSVTTLVNSHVIPVTRELFYDLLQSEPEVAKKIISALTKRLRKQNESIIEQLRTREEQLTALVDERTKELQVKNELITVKNREITDNVNYAKRIQSAILPDLNTINAAFPDSFVLYIPKDIVSGDFYSVFNTEKNSLIIAADCTGHGVTGAFLSVVGNSLLTQIVRERKEEYPGKILDQLHDAMITTLNQRDNESTDGMDIAVCSLDKQSNILKFAGANRPLWLFRNNELFVYSADKFPVGGLQITHEENFKCHEINLLKNDTFYIFSDGYADQFGGDAGKKLMTKKFKEILLNHQHLSMHEQRNFLSENFNSWKGDHEQVDDILVIGVRV